MELYYEDMTDSSMLSPEDICSICYDRRNERIVAAEWNVPIELIEKVKAEHAWITKQPARSSSKKAGPYKIAKMVREKKHQQITRIVAKPIARLPDRPRKLHRMRIPSGWDV